MTTAWLDANVILRFITGDPEPDATRARRLIARANAGELAFRLTTVSVAEVVWTLGTPRNRHSPREVADVVTAFVRGNGIELDEPDVVVEALAAMVDRRVSFVDAYLAVRAILAGEAVCSFDADFKRLGVEILA